MYCIRLESNCRYICIYSNWPTNCGYGCRTYRQDKTEWRRFFSLWCTSNRIFFHFLITDSLHIDTKPCGQNSPSQMVYELWWWRKAKAHRRSACCCHGARCKTHQLRRGKNRSFAFCWASGNGQISMNLRILSIFHSTTAHILSVYFCFVIASSLVYSACLFYAIQLTLIALI